MPGRNFSLTGHLSAFVDRQVETGRHQNASEVVREALRLYEAELELHAAYLDEIRSVAARGIADIEHGRFTTVDSPDDARAVRVRINERAEQLVNEAALQEKE
jgi:antitoxin ParD1/3/4